MRRNRCPLTSHASAATNVARCRRVLSEARVDVSSQARPRATAATARIQASSVVRMPTPRNDRAQTRLMPGASLIETRFGAPLGPAGMLVAETDHWRASSRCDRARRSPAPTNPPSCLDHRLPPSAPPHPPQRLELAARPPDTTTARQDARAGLGKATTPLARRGLAADSQLGAYRALVEHNQRAPPRAPRLGGARSNNSAGGPDPSNPPQRACEDREHAGSSSAMRLAIDTTTEGDPPRVAPLPSCSAASPTG
jgi:hypothetical protein